MWNQRRADRHGPDSWVPRPDRRSRSGSTPAEVDEVVAVLGDSPARVRRGRAVGSCRSWCTSCGSSPQPRLCIPVYTLDHPGPAPPQHGGSDSLTGPLLQQVTDQRQPRLARPGDDRTARHRTNPPPYRLAMNTLTQPHRSRQPVEPIPEILRRPPRTHQEPLRLDIDTEIDDGLHTRG
jgi:hypothetical protein